jgi:hypothetical protein
MQLIENKGRGPAQPGTLLHDCTRGYRGKELAQRTTPDEAAAGISAIFGDRHAAASGF